jgi:hypothetical protein
MGGADQAFVSLRFKNTYQVFFNLPSSSVAF